MADLLIPAMTVQLAARVPSADVAMAFVSLTPLQDTGSVSLIGAGSVTVG